MSTGEVLGYITGVIIVVGFVIRYLISFAIKKNTELEQLKEQNRKKALNRLEKDVGEFRSAIDGIQQQIRELNANFTTCNNQISNLQDRLRQTEKTLDRYEKNGEERLRNMMKTEVTNLTKQLMMIRNKKDG